MPAEMVRHFIRGCWDGDGHIGKGYRVRSWRAIFYCGSLAFIISCHDALVFLGMPSARISCHNRAKVYRVGWYGARCARLFQILYDGVPEPQYLMRKYVGFRAAAIETRTR